MNAVVKPEDQLRDFKYLVSFNQKLQQFKVGYTRTWRYHVDIHNQFPKGFIPYGAGYFSMELDGTDWKVDTINVYGRSEGFLIGPSQRDLDMLKKVFEADNAGDYVETFDTNGNPV